MTTITIDRETRDVIVDYLRSYEAGDFEGFNEALRCADRAEIAELIEYLNWFCGVLDQTGWDVEGDADDYEIEMDDRLLGLVPKWCVEAGEMLEYEQKNLEKVRQGHRGAYRAGTQEESITIDEQEVARHRAAMEILQRLREQLPTGAVA